MADTLPNSHYYNNLGGINQKNSKYEMSTAQFLDLRNLDFDVPNALQKRPGSSLWMASPLSGPIQSLYEYERNLVNSQVPGNFDIILAQANGSVFFNSPQGLVNPTGFTLLTSGWGTSQPIDFLTSADRAWMANGRQWQYWDGISAFPAGLLQTQSALTQTLNYSAAAYAGITYFLMFGITCSVAPGVASFQTVDFMAAYSYVRYDGYEGPMNPFFVARNMMSIGGSAANGVIPLNNGEEVMTPRDLSGPGGFIIKGFTVPSGLGITAIALYFDLHTSTGQRSINFGNGYVGLTCAGAATLLPQASTNFKFFTLLPASTSLFTLTLREISSWSAFVATNPRGQSGITWDFFVTNTPKYIETDNSGTMYMAGFSNAPSTFYYSDVGTPEIINPKNGVEFRSNDGDRIFGLKHYNNQILVLKEHSFEKFIGTDVENYEQVAQSTEFGCISNRTVLTKDQVCYWLDKKGILEYNGANWKIVSDPVEGIFRRMNVTAAKEQACGVNNIYRNQLWWGIPVDGSTTNNITVVYDYLVGAWTFFDGYSPASFAMIRGQLTRPTVWRGDYAGNVHFTGESFFSDSGTGITCLAFTHFENVGGENQTTLWRRIFLDTATASGLTGQIRGQLFTNYDTSTVQATFSTFQDLYQYRVEFGVQGKAVAAQFSHNSASLPLLINGYGYANRVLRNV